MLITGFPSKDIILPLLSLPSPFGLNGLFKIKAFWGNPTEYITHIKTLQDEKGLVFNTTLKNKNTHYVLSINGIDTREKAKKMAGKWLYYKSSVIINNCNNIDKFFIYFTLNCKCYDQNQNYLGEIIDVKNYGGGNILQILHQKKEYFVLFTDDFIHKIDYENKVVVLTDQYKLFI